MQKTRQFILEILRDLGEATVDQIVAELQQRRGSDITAVTVRHHLKHLQREDGLITTAHMLHRSTPGRPQHVYTLTNNAAARFPNNYQRLAQGLLHHIEQSQPSGQVNVILEGVAASMIQDAEIPDIANVQQKLDHVVEYLNQHGYDGSWEQVSDGFVLHTHNCPYHELAASDNGLCQMDMRLISGMLGVVPRLLARISDGDQSCSYFLPLQT